MAECLGCGEEVFHSHLNYAGYCKPCEESPEIEKPPTLLLTTETNPDIPIAKRIDIVSAECVFGGNIFRDSFAGVRDLVGGRSSASQKILRDARKVVLSELSEEAGKIGANAVVAVNLNYGEISGKGKSMLFVVASGTAVIAELDGDLSEGNPL